ncbi:TRAP transporter substrate-binding protein [Sedimentitalea sp. XS_ASV28]|uniref:TRAP transporter substrate-binding protein n=1 Tax=Sedimentitalea sp. XS_ASV28 TaxID=3241296 RepID=UPI003512C354
MNKFAIAAIAALTVASSGVATAEPVTLKVALGSPEPTIWSDQWRRYEQKVEEMSGGDIQLDLFYAGQLGSMGDTLKSTLSGRVDMWSGSVPILSSVSPEFNTLTFPFLFDSDEQVTCVVPKMLEKAQEVAGKKYHFLAFQPIEHQAMAGSEPITAPEMLKGKKVRSAPSQSSINFFQAVGATPLPLPAEETPSAASTGLVEAVNFGLAYAMASGLMQSLPVYTRADLQFNLGATIVSPRTWAKLDEDQKRIMTEALSVIGFEQSTREILDFETAMMDKLKEMGGEVIFLDDSQKKAWTDAARATWDQSLGELRGDAGAFFEAVKSAKDSCPS